FIKDKSLYIPTVFCSYTGDALDKKTPLLRSMDALNTQCIRVLRHLGDEETKKVTPMVGPEQEYFLIDREMYEKRLDLKLCGRTLFGTKPPKGQEMDDHYYGRLRMRISSFMHDLDMELWKMGVFAKTKHNEVAPAQHELAPVYSTANIACDHNQLTMETMRLVAKKHGLACLLHEKPFAGVNGSGKHNNWSLMTDTGKNLFNPSPNPAENLSFLLFIAAMIKGIDVYQELIRYSCACAGNDVRLGGDEAPSVIISVFLGEELYDIFADMEKKTPAHSRVNTCMNMGVSSLPNFTQDTTDRNRTSPCAYTGNKFEFRMCGSSQSIARPCFIINTIMAEELRKIADQLDQAEGNKCDAVANIIRDIIHCHKRILFNGNNYSKEWKEESSRRGLLHINSTIEAIPYCIEEKALDLFERHAVLSRAESFARYETMHDLYAKGINIESLVMIEMAGRQIIPAVMDYCGKLATFGNQIVSLGGDASNHRDTLNELTPLIKEAKTALIQLEQTRNHVLEIMESRSRATAFHDQIIPLMNRLRQACDSLELLIPDESWPIPTYYELMYRV
ncbi:MAG TPA: glutamine synthetase type III, partial [Clostridiales bacterium]|nr:glutamine synthetase type III [Clostridiales bacterium]